MAKAVLVDLTRCMGCRGCQVSCKQWNQREGQKTVFKGDLSNPAQLNVETYTTVHFLHHSLKNGWTAGCGRCCRIVQKPRSKRRSAGISL